MKKIEELKADIEEIKSQYIKQLEEVKAKIEELEQEYESEEETENRWKPKVFEDYWWVSGRGFARRDKCLNSKYDEDVFNHTDVFPTKEQAKFDSERKRIRRELMRYSRPFVTGTKNWFFNYHYRYKTIHYLNSDFSCQPFCLYFESKGTAEKAVETIGEDRIKKYLFGAEEE